MLRKSLLGKTQTIHVHKKSMLYSNLIITIVNEISLELEPFKLNI